MSSSESNQQQQQQQQQPALDTLVQRPNSRIRWAKRVDGRSLKPEDVEEHVYRKNLPLVISNITLSWRRERPMFSWDWLKKPENSAALGATAKVNPINAETQQPDNALMSLVELVDYLSLPESQRPRRLFSPDLPCPRVYSEYILEKLPRFAPKGPRDLTAEPMRELQRDSSFVRIANGDAVVAGRTTPLATIGFNLLAFSEGEDTQVDWLIADTAHFDAAANFWDVFAGGDEALQGEQCFIPFERFAPVSEWRGGEDGGTGKEVSRASEEFSGVSGGRGGLPGAPPFHMYAVEQKEGDLVVLPPRAAHEIAHRGGRSVGVMWHSLPPPALGKSFFDAAPVYRSLGRPELLRLKCIAYYGLINRLRTASDLAQVKDHLEDIVEDLGAVLPIVEDIVTEEWVDLSLRPVLLAGANVVELPKSRFVEDNFPHQRICNFCRCDIFNRCFHCSECEPSPALADGATLSGYDICLECVAEGRGCPHRSTLQLYEYMSAGLIRQHFETGTATYQKLFRQHKRKRGKKKIFQEWKPQEAAADFVSTGTAAFQIVQLWASAANTCTTWRCHQCVKTQPATTALPVLCTSPDCDRIYCARCLWDRYGLKVIDAFRKASWKCPTCRKHSFSPKHSGRVPIDRRGCNCDTCASDNGISQEDVVAALRGHTDTYYPLSKISSPSIAAVSDSKPQPIPHAHFLKKRKFALFSSASNASVSSPSDDPGSVARTASDSVVNSPSLADFTSRHDGEAGDREGLTFEERNGKGTIGEPPSVTGHDGETLAEESHTGEEEYSLDTAESDAKRFRSENTADVADASSPRLDSEDSKVKTDIERPRIIFCRNLKYAIAEQNLLDFFNAVSLSPLTLDDLTIPLDHRNRSRGFAYIRYPTAAEAQRAVDDLNGKELLGRPVDIQLDAESSRTTCSRCNTTEHNAKVCPHARYRDEGTLEALPTFIGNKSEAGSSTGSVEPSGSATPVVVKKRIPCGPRVCFKCGAASHLANQCSSKNRACFLCGVDGHIASDCKNLPRTNQRQGSTDDVAPGRNGHPGNSTLIGRAKSRSPGYLNRRSRSRDRDVYDRAPLSSYDRYHDRDGFDRDYDRQRERSYIPTHDERILGDRDRYERPGDWYERDVERERSLDSRDSWYSREREDRWGAGDMRDDRERGHFDRYRGRSYDDIPAHDYHPLSRDRFDDHYDERSSSVRFDRYDIYRSPPRRLDSWHSGDPLVSTDRLPARFESAPADRELWERGDYRGRAIDLEGDRFYDRRDVRRRSRSTSQDRMDEEDRRLRVRLADLVGQRLSTDYNPDGKGRISTRDEFKRLSRTIVMEVQERPDLVRAARDTRDLPRLYDFVDRALGHHLGQG